MIIVERPVLSLATKATVLLFFALSSVAVWGQAVDCSEERQHYRDLNNPLFLRTGTKGGQGEREAYDLRKKSGTSSLESLVKHLTITKLNGGADPDELTSYLSCIQESDTSEPTANSPEYSLREWDPNATNTPLSVTENVTGGPLNVTAIVINRGSSVLPEPKPFLQCSAKQGSTWIPMGEAGQDFDGRTFLAYQLNSPFPNQMWFLLAGKYFGSTTADLRVEVIACSRNGIVTKWQRDHLYGGKVDVGNEGKTVTLSYIEPGPDGTIPEIHGDLQETSKVLFVTPEGLK